MAARNLIGRKITSKTTLTTSQIIRLLLLCAVVGVWPLLVVLLSTFFPMRPGKIPSYPGWAAVHKDFHDIPMIPWSFLPPVVHQIIERGTWYQIISGLLTFGVFICTEDVRGDISRFWSLLTHNIPCLYRGKAEPLPSPCHEASSHGSNRNPV
jgi:hypothetical protein